MMSGSPRGGNPESANVETHDDQVTHGDARLRTFAISRRAIAESLWVQVAQPDLLHAIKAVSCH